MIRQRLEWFVAAIVFSACACGASAQVDMEALVQQALDQVVDFEVVDKPLPEAFVTVAEQTGVAMSIASDALTLLPYGADTRMTARMKNVPLRDGIDRLLTPLGMRFAIVQDRLEVTPTDALLRISRRAKWTELESLKWLAETEWKANSDDAKKLSDNLQFRVQEPEPGKMLLDVMNQSGKGSAEQLLTAACSRLGWSWYPWEKQVIVLPATEQTARELKRTITLRADHRRLADVLAELASRARMVFHFEPDAIGSLPRETQENFSVLMVDVSVEQALEAIGGATGLQYQVTPDGVGFFNPQSAPAAKGGERPAAILVVPGRGEIPIYENQIPPEMKKSLDALFNGLINAVLSSDPKSPNN